MKDHMTGYWLSLGLFCAVYTFSAIMDLTGVGPAHATLVHLGYPAYVATILGVWKAGAVITLLSPRFARLKEWAYAGIVFDLTGGFISHIAAGDALPKPIIPIVLLALAMTSYVLRPRANQWQVPKPSSETPAQFAVSKLPVT